MDYQREYICKCKQEGEYLHIKCKFSACKKCWNKDVCIYCKEKIFMKDILHPWDPALDNPKQWVYFDDSDSDGTSG